MGYSAVTMNDELEISEISVASLLRAGPKAIHFFLDWRMACAGCGFARFCTLGDVAKAYQIDGTKFLEEARHLIVHSTLSRSSE